MINSTRSIDMVQVYHESDNNGHPSIAIVRKLEWVQLA